MSKQGGPVIRNAILAPELVILGVVLGVAVCDDVSAVAAADYQNLPDLMAGEVVLVPFNVRIARLKNHVAAFTIVDRVQYCSVTLVDPALGQW